MTPNTHTDLALAPPAQNSENTNNPLLAVASSEIVLPDCSLDVEGGFVLRSLNLDSEEDVFSGPTKDGILVSEMNLQDALIMLDMFYHRWISESPNRGAVTLKIVASRDLGTCSEPALESLREREVELRTLLKQRRTILSV